MNKTITKRMFKAIEEADTDALSSILDTHPEALEMVGAHNRLVRDKTPLMYAMQCSTIPLANALLDFGANAAAKMSGGPQSSALALCMKFAYCDKKNHDNWILLASRLIDNGADPNTGLWPALHGYGGVVDRADLIRLCLDRGADPDIKRGDSGNTARELVEVNRHLYSQEVLDLFGLAAP